jgi:hypothetical protein
MRPQNALITGKTRTLGLPKRAQEYSSLPEQRRRTAKVAKYNSGSDVNPGAAVAGEIISFE